MTNEFINQIVCGDAMQLLDEIDAGSIDVVLTDPPYFLDKMDQRWDHKKVLSTANQGTVKSLPAGMKFDKEQGRRLYEWYYQVSLKLQRLLKPGGFFFSFSSPRLYHRMASAVDDAGFQIRDCFIWLYTQNQPKAMSLNHFIDRMDIDETDKQALKKMLNGWKTPQLRSCFEPIIMAQKPYEKTFLNNVLKHGVCLFNTRVKVGDNMFPSNVLTVENIEEVMDKHFLIQKPSSREKGQRNTHRTVKPLVLCQHLIELSTFSPDAIVLDPFVGSGTTAVAAKRAGLKYIGIDTNPECVEIALKRLGQVTADNNQQEKEQQLDLDLRSR